MGFLESALQFVVQYKWILLFYGIITLIVIFNRKKFELENKFILLYKTKYGINFINKFADKNKEFVKLLGYSAIGVGFIGMITIVYFLLKGLYELFFVPSAPPTMSLVIPGVQIPGSPVFIPFWYGIIALFFVVLIHEFGHGIVARAHGMNVKSTGIVFFGPIIGAFVEPDEKTLRKKSSSVQQSVFAAGPFFNALLALFVFVLLVLIFNPLMAQMVEPSGVKFSTIQEGLPAEKFGVTKDTVYDSINGVSINTSEEFVTSMSCVRPNDSVVLSGPNGSVSVIAGENPTDPKKGYLGVAGMKTEYSLKSQTFLYKTSYNVLYMLVSLLEWVFMLSVGIGLANLLPLGPVDGGRMIHIALVDIHGEKKGVKFWSVLSIFVLVTMVVLVFIPILKAVIFKA